MRKKLSEQHSRAAGHHAKTALRTYVALSVAFVCMMGINTIAYYTIERMNAIYTSQQNVSMRIKLNILQSNLMFKEIISGQSQKDMNEVWKLMEASKHLMAKLEFKSQGEAMMGQLENFRVAVLKSYKFFKSDVAESESTASRSKLGGDKEKTDRGVLLARIREEYGKAFDGLLASSDDLELRIAKSVEDKMLVFKVLYIALLVNVLALFWFTFHTFRGYINKSRDAEEQLLGAQENLSTVINSLESSIIAVDSIGGVIQWSSVSQDYFGFSEEAAKEQILWEMLPFFEPFKSDILKVFHSKQPLRVDHVKSSQFKGRVFDIDMNFSSGIKAVVIRVDDVTDKEMKDEQLRQSQKMEVVENLIGGMAHNFNNVLGAITGTVSMLKYAYDNHQLTGDEDVGSNIEVIETSAERAVVMIQQLVKLSERHVINLKTVDLNNAIEHVINVCANTLDKRIELVAEVYDMPALVVADPMQVEQLLLNLCDNAAQAMTVMRGDGELQGGTLSITIDRVFANRKFQEEHPKANEGSYWIICVADTGKGIDKTIAAKIFDPFFSTKRGEEVRSTGLGLTMVCDIVERHKGFVEFSSVVNEGTKFNIYLPELVEEAAAGLALEEAIEEAAAMAAATPVALDIKPSAEATPPLKPPKAALVPPKAALVSPKAAPELVAPPKVVVPAPLMGKLVEPAPAPVEPAPAPAVPAPVEPASVPAAPEPVEPAPVPAAPAAPLMGVVVKGIPVVPPQVHQPSEAPPAVPSIPTGSGLILVVDDEAILRKTAKSILKKLGYEVIFGEDGEDGVNVFRERHEEIALVMLDMAMPKMSGKEAFVEMKKIDSGVRAIVVSGFSMNEDIKEVLALGGRGFVEKPYSIVNLANEINRAITGQS